MEVLADVEERVARSTFQDVLANKLSTSEPPMNIFLVWRLSLKCWERCPHQASLTCRSFSSIIQRLPDAEVSKRKTVFVHRNGKRLDAGDPFGFGWTRSSTASPLPNSSLQSLIGCFQVIFNPLVPAGTEKRDTDSHRPRWLSPCWLTFLGDNGEDEKTESVHSSLTIIVWAQSQAALFFFYHLLSSFPHFTPPLPPDNFLNLHTSPSSPCMVSSSLPSIGFQLGSNHSNIVSRKPSVVRWKEPRGGSLVAEQHKQNTTSARLSKRVHLLDSLARFTFVAKCDKYMPLHAKYNKMKAK